MRYLLRECKSSLRATSHRYLGQFTRGYKPLWLYYQDVQYTYQLRESNALCSLSTFRKGACDC